MLPLEYSFKVFGPAGFSLYFVITAGLLSSLESAKTSRFQSETGPSLDGVSEYEVVHPVRVDSTGHFLSNHVSHRVSRVQRRETGKTPEHPTQVFYHLQYGGQELHFNLTLNPHLLAPGFVTERRYGGLQGSTLHGHGHSLCYFLGDVRSSTLSGGQASVSTCSGLSGLFQLSGGEFFISPLEPTQEVSTPQAHAIYKRHADQSEHQLPQPLFGEHTGNGTCGVKDPQGGVEQVDRRRERWERRQRRRRIKQRSVSTEKWVETLVVADPKMVEYHGRKGVVSYVLSVMNIVAGLFRDASIGNAINIVVVRLILLEEDEVR
ncbi:A disintegrin and metalloproteinase with thrombospondin motifs 7 [Triplophysa tibetana]|uniref:A disintegrin and metalloproteinase with thrombospondin motifs 7 n=1 Tax=Triplophysa tibetana TaxID=1572043 RepID=A0A5A9PP24_9TELE|nr:A disintegrin and metalloproteinase with thrombospondin motifs 7 [Triplophysa tibetana]